MEYKQLHHDLDSSGNFLPSHEEHNQPSIPPMISGTLNEAGVINDEALGNLPPAQIGDTRPYFPGNLSVATTDAAHATGSHFMFDHNDDCFDSSVNDAFGRYPCYDLPDTITDYGAMPFFPAEPPMQRSETNVSAASTAWLESNTQLNPLDRETRGQPETETANVSNLELRDLPSNSEAASLTRRPSKGKKGLNRKRCRYCKESFRGNHERERHRKAKHATCVKRFVCRDPPTEAGTVSKLSVIQPLSECKVCVMGKEYNKDYNAGEHLRKHFMNKPSRDRNSVKEPGGEKRGGMGDQDQDPKIRLNDLRPWIVGFTVNLGEDCEAPNDKEL
ncbi:hypothetical protein E4U10_005827 [Claviceps purpurea]|nr:hypothetical protein E4U10_005827 [Claviceps purpurea]